MVVSYSQIVAFNLHSFFFCFFKYSFNLGQKDCFERSASTFIAIVFLQFLKYI